MTVSIIKLSSVILDSSAGVLREPPRPVEQRPEDYSDKFDYKTLFYDVFQESGKITLSGPPLLNLQKVLNADSFEVDGNAISPAQLILGEVDRTQRSYIDIEQHSEFLSISLGAFIETVDINENNLDLFDGKIVLVTKSKNNEIAWIRDWIQFYRDIHCVNAILLYDNNSDIYTISELADGLSDIENVDIYLIPWNFPFGPQGGGWTKIGIVPWDSDFCEYGILEHAKNRFLKKADLVINVDIDELLICKDLIPVHELMTKKNVDLINFKGHWIESLSTISNEIPSFKDFILVDENRGKTTTKWVVKPKNIDISKQWKTHYIVGHSLALSEELAHRHFMAITTHWKFKRDRLVRKPGLITPDIELVKSFQKVWPSYDFNQLMHSSLIFNLQYCADFKNFFGVFLVKTWLYKLRVVVFEFCALDCKFAIEVVFEKDSNNYKIKIKGRDGQSQKKLSIALTELAFLTQGYQVFSGMLQSIDYVKAQVKYIASSIFNVLLATQNKNCLDSNFDFSLRSFQQTLLRNLYFKGENVVGFVVNDATKWNATLLLKKLLSSGFTVKIFIALSGRASSLETRINEIAVLKTFFEPFEFEVVSLFDSESNSQRHIAAEEADILFLQQPWGLEWLVDKAKTQQLLVYMPYGYLMYRNDEMEYNRPRFHPFLWRYFTQSEQHKALCLAYPAFNAQNVVVTGYPKLDTYNTEQPTARFSWPKSENNTRIIFAPHHSLPNETLKISTFDWNHNAILTFAQKYPTTSWVYRPHGRLPYVVERNNVMSEAEYAQYEQQWASLENTTLYKVGEYFDLFKTSDVLITDCSSFLGEYLPTGKPVIWLVSANPAYELNAVGKLITDTYYKVTNLEELAETFQRVVIAQQDDLKPKRLAVMQQLFNDGYSASVKVVEHITQQIAEAGSIATSAKAAPTLEDFTQMLTDALLLARPIAKVALAYLKQHTYPDVNEISFITFNNQKYFGATEDDGYVINLEQGLKRLILQLDKAKPEFLSLDGIVFLRHGQKIDISSLAYKAEQSSDYKGRQANYLLQGSRNHTQADLHPWWQVEFAEPLNCDQIILLNRADIYGKRNNTLSIEAQLEDGSLQTEYVDLRHIAFSSLMPPAADREKLIKSLGFMLYHNVVELPKGFLSQVSADILQQQALSYQTELVVLAANLCQQLTANGLPLNAFTNYQTLLNSETKWEQLAFFVNHLAAFKQQRPYRLTAEGFLPLTEAELQQLENNKPTNSTHINTDNLVKPNFNQWPWPLIADQNMLVVAEQNQQATALFAQSAGAGYFAANSIIAIEHALSLPCSGIELNVTNTKTGELVLHQGEFLTPAYTQNAAGDWLNNVKPVQVSELTLAQLQQYQIGQLPRQSEFKFYYPEWQSSAGQTIVTLQAALALVAAKTNEHTTLVLDLQLALNATNLHMAEWLQQVKQLTANSSFAGLLVLSTSNWRFARYLKQHWPEQSVWLGLYPAGWLNPAWANEYDPIIAAAEQQHIQVNWQHFASDEGVLQQLQDPLQLLNAAAQLPVDGLSLPLSYLPFVSTLAQPLNLPIFWLAGNERQQRVLQQASKLGALGIAHHTPCLRFQSLSNPEIKLVDSAKTWFKTEKWHEVKTHFSEYLIQTAGECHFDIYYRLAIALRKLEQFNESEHVLKQALKFYPNNYRAFIELAALENQRSNWSQALEYWRSAYLIAGAFSVTSYQRFARAVAANGQTDPLYTQMFNDALETSATDRIFFTCYSFYQILLLVDEGQIAQALKQLTPLTNSYLFSSQGIPHLYLYRELHLKQHAAAYQNIIQTEPQAFNNEIVSDKPTRLMPYDVANLHFVVTCLSHQAVTDQVLFIELNELLEPIVAYAKRAPANLCHALIASEQALQQAVTALARFITQCSFNVESVPAKAWFILGDIVLLGFHFDAYARLRQWAITALRAAEPDASYYPDTAVKMTHNTSLELPADSIVKALAFNGKAAFSQYFSHYRHSNFANYVHQKRIAVVGPVTPEHDQSDEIDSFDLVIRLNFRGQVQLSGKGAGSKTHISYYANDLIDGDNTTVDILDGIAELNWAVFDTETNLGNKGRLNHARMHFPYRTYNPLSKGVVNAIQKVLLDLMLYEPAEIKVFNTNLWLSQRTIPGYHIGHERNEVSRFIWHDAKANFIFLQGLWQSGYISADTELSRVLAMDADNYLRALHQVYSPAAQPLALQG